MSISSPDDRHGYRVAFMEAFRERGILPSDVRTISTETLAWNAPEDPRPEWLGELIASIDLDWNQNLTRSKIFALNEENRGCYVARHERRSSRKHPDLYGAVRADARPAALRQGRQRACRKRPRGRLDLRRVRRAAGAPGRAGRHRSHRSDRDHPAAAARADRRQGHGQRLVLVPRRRDADPRPARGQAGDPLQHRQEHAAARRGSSGSGRPTARQLPVAAARALFRRRRRGALRDDACEIGRRTTMARRTIQLPRQSDARAAVAARRRRAAARRRCTVRHYCQGIGDCHLLVHARRSEAVSAC